DNLQSAKRNPSEILAYLELHIEQGGILEAEKINIGVVEGIVGINLWNVSVLGLANHAGTTPMDQRKDALLAAARLVDSVNHIARSSDRSGFDNEADAKRRRARCSGSCANRSNWNDLRSKRRWNQPLSKRIYNTSGCGGRRQRFDASNFGGR